MAQETKPVHQTADQKAADQKKLDEKKPLPPANVQPQAEVDPVHIAVTNCPDFRESIIMLLDGAAGEINANKDDPNAVAKVAARLKERSGTYADAVVANTHYAPVPTVETEKGRQEREAKEKQEAAKTDKK